MKRHLLLLVLFLVASVAAAVGFLLVFWGVGLLLAYLVGRDILNMSGRVIALVSLYSGILVGLLPCGCAATVALRKRLRGVDDADEKP